MDYLDGYKILTINRNPFDAFLSYTYQNYTHWKNPHRQVKDNKFMEVSFKIDCSFIGKFCDELKIQWSCSAWDMKSYKFLQNYNLNFKIVK